MPFDARQRYESNDIKKLFCEKNRFYNSCRRSIRYVILRVEQVLVVHEGCIVVGDRFHLESTIPNAQTATEYIQKSKIPVLLSKLE
jgi:hypothetical protein